MGHQKSEPLMDGFQILRCLWKRLEKMLQSIILEFSKTKNLTQKRPPKIPKNKKNTYKEASNQTS